MHREEFLQILVDLQAFRVCAPLKASEVVKELEACGTRANLDLLERFEQFSWERPLAHLHYPKQIMKLISLEGESGRFRTKPLQENEVWDGRTKDKYINPQWAWNDLIGWLEEGYMRAFPEGETFVWSDYYENGRESGAPYYSKFQIYDLVELIISTTMHDNAAWIPENKADVEFERWADGRTSWSQRKRRVKNPKEFTLGASEVCQAIASRYYFHTQTDGRVIRTNYLEEMWDWDRYCREWEPEFVTEQLGITPDEVKRLQDRLRFISSLRDPLAEWYDLLQFISIERKARLKGKARYAQLLYSMEYMLRMFYRDLTGEELEPAQSHPSWTIDDTIEEHRHGDPRYLRYVANRYKVNPQPRLVLYVEGAGEARVIPELARKRFGASLEHYGIVLRNLGSVTEFAGSKAEKKYGALRRSIEELHAMQIITFVLLDNEDSRIEAVKKRLCTTPSSYHPKRTITRQELVFVWNASMEFDNFSDSEISKAMTEISESRYCFSADEVSLARSSFGTKGDPISKLYNEKLDYGLKKVDLLVRLSSNLPKAREPRPIDIIVDKILEFAALNHQPTMAYTDDLNQTSGMLGHPVGESNSNRASEEARKSIEDGFKPLRELQEILVASK